MTTTTPAAPLFQGAIFDGDTHLYETPDAFSRYLPEKFKKDWSYEWKVGADGEYALYVGERKVEVSAGYYAEDGRVPPPGKLHEWLRAMKEGKENVDMRVPMTPDMYRPRRAPAEDGRVRRRRLLPLLRQHGRHHQLPRRAEGCGDAVHACLQPLDARRLGLQLQGPHLHGARWSRSTTWTLPAQEAEWADQARRARCS